MSNKDSQTKAFGTVNKNQKGFKSDKSRQKFVILIFVVIIAILSLLAYLIVGEVMDRLQIGQTTTTTQPPQNVIYIQQDAGNVKMGDMLFIDGENQFDFSSEVGNIKNLWEYKNDPANNSSTKIKIGSKLVPTYELFGKTTANRIALEETTLNAFNSLILAYCQTLDLSGYKEGPASKLSIGWGHYEDVEEYENDLLNDSLGLDYYDHALGKALTLYYNGVPLNESTLKSSFEWIYDHAHEYGFIIRYPNACEHFGDEYNRSKRLHLRYVGVVHATAIKEKGVCLDEYLADLRTNHKNYDKPLEVKVGDKTYNVYYYAYSANPTSIPILKNNKGYEISGDNMNGFIVTVEK